MSKKVIKAAPAATSRDNGGRATFYDHGFIVINANGALETKASPVVIAGCSSGNIRSMQQAKAVFAMEFAKRAELSTDDSSPDDVRDNGGRAVFVDLGFDVVNANGALETHAGLVIIPGCTSGNIKSMTEAKAAFAMEFANRSELSTDESSADDAG